jgi:hypothetical protein
VKAMPCFSSVIVSSTKSNEEMPCSFIVVTCQLSAPENSRRSSASGLVTATSRPREGSQLPRGLPGSLIARDYLKLVTVMLSGRGILAPAGDLEVL